jgi:undecaprenyl pyrophosphate synthase
VVDHISPEAARWIYPFSKDAWVNRKRRNLDFIMPQFKMKIKRIGGQPLIKRKHDIRWLFLINPILIILATTVLG